MAYRYRILPAQKFIFVGFSKETSLAEIIECSETVARDADYAHGMHGVIDLSRIERAALRHEITELVEFSLSKRKHGQGEWAVLVTTPLLTAFTMIYQRAVSDAHPFSLFSTHEGAADFLNVSPAFVREGLEGLAE